MNLLSKLITPAPIAVDRDVADKAGALDAAAALFAAATGADAARIRDSLAEREALGSTGLGLGVAIPHGRLRGLRSAVAAVVRLRQPVPFEAPDGRPVGLLIALLVPDNARQEHLDLLSELAQMLSDPELRAGLMSAPSADALRACVAGWAPIRPAA
jgi:PTS system nitrogen regulatory IIA component